MTSLWFKVLLCSLLPFYFAVHFTNKQYILINTSKAGPSTLCPSEKPQIEMLVENSEDEIIPGKTRSKYSKAHMPSPRCALVNLLVFLLLDTWCIFTRDVYPQKAGWAVILGHPSVSVSVCCSLGEERGCGCWPRAQTEAELPTHCFLVWFDTVTLVHWIQKKNGWMILMNLCFEGTNEFWKYESQSNSRQFAYFPVTHGAWVICSVLLSHNFF